MEDDAGIFRVHGAPIATRPPPTPARVQLFKGGHSPPREGAPLEICFDETVAWMFGEGHTDSPACMCPVLAAMGMRLNDRFDDDERQLMIPLLARCGGTRSTQEVQYRRAMVMLDASVREIGPLALGRWPDLADRLRAISPIVDRESAKAARVVTVAVLDEATKRRGDDVGDAATASSYVAYVAFAVADAVSHVASGATGAGAAFVGDVVFDGAYAASDAASYDDDRSRSAARRPVVLATIAAFERAIEVR